MSLFTLRIFLILGIIGHGINFWCDRVLSITPNGRLTFDSMNDINDNTKMAALYKGVNPDIPFKSAMFGSLSLALEFFGYFSITFYIWTYSTLLGSIMFIGSIIFAVIGCGHHVKYAIGLWMFIKGGYDKKSFEMLNELYNKLPITKCAYIGYIIYVIALIVAICTGVGSLSLWCVIFSVLPYLYVYIHLRLLVHCTYRLLLPLLAGYLLSKLNTNMC